MTANRVSWYTEWLQAGLDTKILTEADILAHATPAVLIAALPRDILASVLGGAMSSGTSSPAEVVRIVQPARLAEHVPEAILWPCLAVAAERAGISAPRPATTTDAPARELLRRVLAAGLAQAQLTPSDVVRHVDASVLAHALPDALAQKLLEACLASGKVTPELILETLGVDGITAHAPLHVVWACLAAAADPAAKSSAAVKKQSLEPIDDDVASVLVDLDDSGVLKPMIVESKEAAKPTKNVVRRSGT